MIVTKQTIIDAPVVAAAASSPLWIDLINYANIAILGLGGLVLLGLRIAVAYREWNRGKNPKTREEDGHDQN